VKEPVPFEDLLRREYTRAAKDARRRTSRKAAPVESAPPEPGTSWRANLIVNNQGAPRPLLTNAITALRFAPEWAGVLAFNQFSLGAVALGPPPWGTPKKEGEWTDHEDRLTANWLQQQGIYVSVEIAGQAVQTVAKDRPFHPVRDYLNSLVWDGTKRIDTWLNTYLGAEQNDYTAAVGSRWLISAVARVFHPGAKADCCLILEGPQGSKKSTALKTLAGEWFTDEIADLGSKDAALQTLGAWVIEIAELDSMTRADVGRVKAFMSRAVDRFRPPYGRRVIVSPRQCVFAGSVNHNTYLRDETGGRRFWPVACADIVIDDLARDRGQLWAEALTRYRAGSPWWLDSVELNRQAAEVQSERYDGDPWDEVILKWIDGRQSVSIPEILAQCIQKKVDMWTQSDRHRVARCLKSSGWERYFSGPRGAREWRYRPPREVEDDGEAI